MTEKLAAARVTGTDPRSIVEYHAHVYYDSQTARGRAEYLRERVAAEFPPAKLGRWHDRLVGPHTHRCIRSRFRAACWSRSCRG